MLILTLHSTPQICQHFCNRLIASLWTCFYLWIIQQLFLLSTVLSNDDWGTLKKTALLRVIGIPIGCVQTHMNKIIHTQSNPPTSLMGMMKGSALFFCCNLSEIRFKRDMREEGIIGGRKETDWGGCIVRNGTEWSEEENYSKLVMVKLQNNIGENNVGLFGCEQRKRMGVWASL